MKRQPILMFLFASLFVALVSGVLLLNTEAKRNDSVTEVSTLALNHESNGLESRTKIGDVPDNIAYELFFRTVGEHNARGLVKRAGLTEEKLEQVVSEAKSLYKSYESSDKYKRQLRENKSQPATEKQTAFQRVKEQTEINLERVVTRYLPQGLGEEDWQKFQEFIETEVKPNIQIIPAASLEKKNAKNRNDSEARFLKTSAERTAAQSSGNIYLYSAGWKDGGNVFGSGTIAESQTSYTSYLVTTTVTSPSGRANTTSGGWNYATNGNNTGLSIGVEDGTYNIQATFEADAGGYYDEWGNYYSYGTYTVGSSVSVVQVNYSVSLTRAVPEDAGLVNRGSKTVFTGTIRLTNGIPESRLPVTLVLDFNENYKTQGVVYSVYPNGDGTGNQGRSQTVTHNIRGASIDFAFTTQTSSTSPPETGSVNGEVSSEMRIRSATDKLGNSVPIETANRDVIFKVAPSNPTVGGGGGGGGGCGQCGWAGLGCSGCANYSVYPGGCPYPLFVNGGCCCQGSPIVIDVNGDGFAMTDGENGVLFDLNGDGGEDQTSWTAANSDDAWLALDRNENNVIDNGKELFGNYCDQPDPPTGVLRNGFIGLAEYDKTANGGNGDGKITRADAVFKKLRLWQDKNHNGVSEPEELSKLPALDVVAFFLDYKESKRTDEFGNRFKYKARVRDARGARVGRWAWDVFTVPPR